MVEVRVDVSIPESLGRVVAQVVAVVAWLVSVISIVSTKPVHINRGGAMGGVNLGQASVNLVSINLQWKSEGEISSFQIKAVYDV